MAIAHTYASFSEDPSTQVGAVVVRENVQLSAGWNGLPRGVKSSPYRTEQRPSKYAFMEHAERNAVYNAARTGAMLEGSDMYLTAYFSCSDCARCIVQAGIKRLIIPCDAPQPQGEHYKDDFIYAREILDEGKVEVVEYSSMVLKFLMKKKEEVIEYEASIPIQTTQADAPTTRDSKEGDLSRHRKPECRYI